MKNRLVIWKILFVVLLLFTIVSFCVLIAGSVQSATQIDDKLGAHLAVPIGLVLLVIVLIQELVIYKGVKYFLRGKDTRIKAKTAVYISLLVLDFLIILLEAIYIFSYISTI